MKTQLTADELATLIAEMRRDGGRYVEGQSDAYLADLLHLTRGNVDHAIAEAKAALELLVGA